MRDRFSDHDAAVLEGLALRAQALRTAAATAHANTGEGQKALQDTMLALDDIIGDLTGSADKLLRESEDTAAGVLADQRIAERKEEGRL